MSPNGTSVAENKKTNAVKDKKFKSAFKNYSSVYVKESGGSAFPDENEKEICSQLRNISLVKDSSKMFTPDALKVLAGRLGSVLSVEESGGNEKKQVPASEESPSSSQERSKEFKVETLDMESMLSEHSKGNDSSSDEMEQHDFEDSDPELPYLSDDEKPRSSYFFKLENNRIQNYGGESVNSDQEEQSVSKAPILLCDKCQCDKWKKTFSSLGNGSQSITSNYSIFRRERMEDYSRRKTLLRMSKKESNVDSLEMLRLPTVCGSCEVWFDSDGEIINHFGSREFLSGYFESEYRNSLGDQTPSVDKKCVYLCLFCSFRSPDIETLNKHKKTHTSGKFLSCELCSNGTSMLCPHKLKDEKIHRCPFCSFRSTTSLRLLLHKRVHF